VQLRLAAGRLHQRRKLRRRRLVRAEHVLEVARQRYVDDVLVQEVLAFIASPERKREMCRPGRMTADDDDDA
jgi:hypothetical protein